MTKTNLSPSLVSSNSLAAANDIHPLKAPIPIPNPWFWAGLLVAALVLALGGWWWWRKRKRDVPASPAEPPIPPHERALARLKEALGLLHEPRPFCILTSDTIRVYLEERFHLRAPERTTEEFLDELQTSPNLSFEQKQVLGEFLTGCDLVKFAKAEPRPDELQGIYEAAVRLVEETQPPPPALGPVDSRASNQPAS